MCIEKLLDFIFSLWKLRRVEDLYLNVMYIFLNEERTVVLNSRKHIIQRTQIQRSVSIEGISLRVDFPSYRLSLYCKTTDHEGISRECLERDYCLR